MSPLDPMADAALVDSLTEYYSEYRHFLKEGGDRTEFLACQSKLIRLLSELNHKMGRFADLNHQDEKMATEDSV